MASLDYDPSELIFCSFAFSVLIASFPILFRCYYSPKLVAMLVGVFERRFPDMALLQEATDILLGSSWQVGQFDVCVSRFYFGLNFLKTRVKHVTMLRYICSCRLWWIGFMIVNASNGNCQWLLSRSPGSQSVGNYMHEGKKVKLRKINKWLIRFTLYKCSMHVLLYQYN